jgi:hypothetical protein
MEFLNQRADTTRQNSYSPERASSTNRGGMIFSIPRSQQHEDLSLSGTTDFQRFEGKQTLGFTSKAKKSRFASNLASSDSQEEDEIEFPFGFSNSLQKRKRSKDIHEFDAPIENVLRSPTAKGISQLIEAQDSSEFRNPKKGPQSGF